MLTTALSFLAGICSLNQLSTLPGNGVALLLPAAMLLWWYYRNKAFVRILALTCFFIAGFVWALFQARTYLDHRLPENLAGVDIRVQGKITGLPAGDGEAQRFVFEIERYETEGLPAVMPRRLRLSWYYGPPLHSGERWRLLLRLKPPHGFMNPGGFDYEAWLYQQRIHATGYVRDDAGNRLLQPAMSVSIASLRQRISALITTGLAQNPYAGLVTALAVGDRSAITPAQWNTLIATGTNHLMAISGLHIGLAAAFGYWICRRLYPTALMRRLPAQQACMVFGLITALSYALLAGFSIPTQRALLMLLCITGAWLFKRTTRPLDLLAFALLAVLLWDPVAVLSPGFWFSFLAVTAIFHTMTGAFGGEQVAGWGGVTMRALRRWAWLPLVIALALFPLSLYLFQQASLVAPLANMVMVPYVSFLIVPLVLLALLFAVIAPSVSLLLFDLAARLFGFIWPLPDWLSEQSYALWAQASPPLYSVLLAMAGLAVMLSPRIGRKRGFGVLLLLPSLLLRPAMPVDGDFELHVLDVGQGLASVIVTREHALVYDTGARFSERLDSGNAVVAPFLRSRGIDHIDLLMISHSDADHIGGAGALLARWPSTPVSGQGIESLPALDSGRCKAGQNWRWDGVEFEVLHPDDAPYNRRNNFSCVLRVANAGGSVLLTGDIEDDVERRLIETRPRAIDADVLVVPHHGSETSSSTDFIAAVSPDTAIFASGYHNRYGFPREQIVRRYRQQGVRLYATGDSGAISIRVDKETGIQPAETYRETRRRYWNHVVDMLQSLQAVEKPQGKVS
jgi:competence protein ComEC